MQIWPQTVDYKPSVFIKPLNIWTEDIPSFDPTLFYNHKVASWTRPFWPFDLEGDNRARGKKEKYVFPLGDQGIDYNDWLGELNFWS